MEVTVHVPGRGLPSIRVSAPETTPQLSIFSFSAPRKEVDFSQGAVRPEISSCDGKGSSSSEDLNQLLAECIANLEELPWAKSCVLFPNPSSSEPV